MLDHVTVGHANETVFSSWCTSDLDLNYPGGVSKLPVRGSWHMTIEDVAQGLNSILYPEDTGLTILM